MDVVDNIEEIVKHTVVIRYDVLRASTEVDENGRRT
jgi:hypothetical protein